MNIIEMLRAQFTHSEQLFVREGGEILFGATSKNAQEHVVDAYLELISFAQNPTYSSALDDAFFEQFHLRFDGHFSIHIFRSLKKMKRELSEPQCNWLDTMLRRLLNSNQRENLQTLQRELSDIESAAQAYWLTFIAAQHGLPFDAITKIAANIKPAQQRDRVLESL